MPGASGHHAGPAARETPPPLARRMAWAFPIRGHSSGRGRAVAGPSRGPVLLESAGGRSRRPVPEAWGYVLDSLPLKAPQPKRALRGCHRPTDDTPCPCAARGLRSRFAVHRPAERLISTASEALKAASTPKPHRVQRAATMPPTIGGILVPEYCPTHGTAGRRCAAMSPGAV